MSRPVIAITMGDPAGIGPEVALRAIASPAVRRCASPLLVGDLGVFRETAKRLRLPLEFAVRAGRASHLRAAPTSAAPGGGRRSAQPGARRRALATPVEVTSTLATAARRAAHPTPPGGDAAYRAILAAVDLVQAGLAAAMVTAPINKANLNAAGHDVPGHTELLAWLTHSRAVRMMMAAPDLRVVLATTHVAIAKLPSLLTRALVLDTILTAEAALRRHFGLRRPHIAVCGLNPHAGEGGLFGSEDERVIRPAVAAARRRRIDAVGPLPADTVFAQARRGTYDAVVCMYHDQGLAPFKLIHFEDGVNVTLGLPFVRTSPDHGTAFDIAGKGRADPSSMIAAVILAAALAAP